MPGVYYIHIHNKRTMPAICYLQSISGYTESASFLEEPTIAAAA